MQPKNLPIFALVALTSALPQPKESDGLFPSLGPILGGGSGSGKGGKCPASCVQTVTVLEHTVTLPGTTLLFCPLAQMVAQTEARVAAKEREEATTEGFQRLCPTSLSQVWACPRSVVEASEAATVVTVDSPLHGCGRSHRDRGSGVKGKPTKTSKPTKGGGSGGSNPFPTGISELASYDDIFVDTAASELANISTHMGLAYNGFEVLEALVPTGDLFPSGNHGIVNGLNSALSGSSIVPADLYKSMDIKSLYFGCAGAANGALTGQSSSCTAQFSGYAAGSGKLKKTITQTFSRTGAGAMKMVQVIFDDTFKDLSKITVKARGFDDQAGDHRAVDGQPGL